MRRADVTATFTMLDMEMGQLAYHLPETAPGRYERVGSGARHGRSLGPVVRYPTSRRKAPFTVVLVDKANG